MYVHFIYEKNSKNMYELVLIADWSKSYFMRGDNV